ncbi:MAG: hypothetical protein HKO76_01110 [Acidimicrobiia bacterium]|nr:hypothetical protein [Acidimicrobiia bacterium]
MEDTKKREEIDLDHAHLDRPGVHIWLGKLVAQHLKVLGSVTLFLGEDHKIRIANPEDVYLGPQAVIDEVENGNRSVRWVKPIERAAKPKLAALKDGALWEIEFTDD